MNYQRLGQVYQGEQSPGVPFWRYVDPTEFDKAVGSLGDQVGRMSIPWGEKQLCRGFMNSGTQKFLKAYIQISRERAEPVNTVNLNNFQMEMLNRFDIKPLCSGHLMTALLDLAAAGQIHEVIYNPVIYADPPEPVDKLKNAAKIIRDEAAAAAGGTVNKVLIAAVIVAGVYIAAPYVAKGLSGRRGRPEAILT